MNVLSRSLLALLTTCSINYANAFSFSVGGGGCVGVCKYKHISFSTGQTQQFRDNNFSNANIQTQTPVNNISSPLQICLDTLNNDNYKDSLKYCKNYGDSNVAAALALARAYMDQKEYAQALIYVEKIINHYKTEAPDDESANAILANAYSIASIEYLFGQGTEVDIEKGIQYAKNGAALGSAFAQYILSGLYGGAIPGKEQLNFIENYYWATLSGLNGDSEAEENSLLKTYPDEWQQYPYCIAIAQDKVANAYYEGIDGLDKNITNALIWAQKAEQSDNQVSYVNLYLAKMYHMNGNDSKAFEYAQKAAEQPYPQALQYLGTLYQQGIGTPVEPVKANAYLTISIELYNKPDDTFFEQYIEECRPDYKTTDDEFNAHIAQGQINYINLDTAQLTESEKLLNKIENKWKK